MDMTLSAKHLSVRLGGRHILSDVSLEVSSGDRIAVLGANGAGKSTLLSCLTNELRADQGDVLLAGQALHRMPATERARRLAVMPQSVTLSFPLRVHEVVALGRSPHMDEVRTRHWQQEAMQLMGVWHLRGREYTGLSGGEQQRTQMARVLVQIWSCREKGGEGHYLLLDECFSAADPAHQHSIMNRVSEFAGAGVGVLAVMHDMALAASWADRVLLLKQGEVVAFGPVELLTMPQILQVVYDLPGLLANDYARNNRHWMIRNPAYVPVKTAVAMN
jgi:iron complex transport system ATP-binding protein